MSESTGYDPHFLDIPLALPTPPRSRIVRTLAYTHFTVLLDPVRRLALATGVNIDGDLLLDLERGDNWHLDDRVLETEQAGEDLYARNDLDRGHLVRRRDPVWGDRATAQRANDDTFVFTNAAPQAAKFNQGEELWSGLEDHVLEYARAGKARISVFTAPVLNPADPVYRGIRVPRRFWKIAAWVARSGGEQTLRAAAFVLDQSPQLDAIDVRRAEPDSPPPLGPFRTFQVPVTDVAALAPLDLTTLSEADVLAAAPRTGAAGASWIRLTTAEDILLG
jgi:endonuclease G